MQISVIPFSSNHLFAQRASNRRLKTLLDPQTVARDTRGQAGFSCIPGLPVWFNQTDQIDEMNRIETKVYLHR